MKLAMIPEKQRRGTEQRRQTKSLQTVLSLRDNPESGRGLAEQRAPLQKLRPKSKF